MSGIVGMISCNHRHNILSDLMSCLVRLNFTGQKSCLIAMLNRQREIVFQFDEDFAINAFPRLTDNPDFYGPLGVGCDGDYDGHQEPIFLESQKAFLVVDASKKATLEIADIIRKKPRLSLGIAQAMKQVKAPFALIALSDNRLVGARNSGLKSLCYGQLWESNGRTIQQKVGYYIASQSGVVNRYCNFIDGIRPGEILTLSPRKLKLRKVIERPDMRRCLQRILFLEIPGSRCAGRAVTDTRQSIGHALGIKFRQAVLNDQSIKDFTAISIPLGGNFYLYGFGESTGIFVNPGAIIRNMHNTNVRPFEGMSIPVNLNVVKEAVEGKHVVLVEDEAITGHKFQDIAGQCRQKEALSVHAVCATKLMSSCPYRDPSYTFHGRIGQRNAAELGVDTLTTLEIHELIGAIGASSHNYCADCLHEKNMIE